jgi:hypothetical protein
MINYSDALLRMSRIYRGAFLLDQIQEKCGIRNVMYHKLKNLFGTITIILPIIVKFVPFFLVIYYILGILGMEIFYEAKNIPTNPYSFYN